jgi:hypothetical protein
MIGGRLIGNRRSVTHLKDLDNVLDAARGRGLEAVPCARFTANLFRGLIDRWGDLDHSAPPVERERRNGVTSAHNSRRKAS